MSPRAAWRLERLGYTVYDYAAGKADWRAAGLDTARGASLPAQVLDALDRDVATCAPDTQVSGFDPDAAPYVVVNDQHVVLGRLRATDLADAPPDSTVEDVMQPGPATVRADADLEQTRDRLRQRHIPALLVTTPQGELLGTVSASD